MNRKFARRANLPQPDGQTPPQHRAGGTAPFSGGGNPYPLFAAPALTPKSCYALTMLGVLLVIAGSFIIGFTVGFGVREMISRRRRRRQGRVILW